MSTTTDPILDPLRAMARKELLKAIVGRAIFCPRSGEVLDVRTCVVFVDGDGDPCAVMSQKGYRTMIEANPKAIESLNDMDVYLDESTVKPDPAAPVEVNPTSTDEPAIVRLDEVLPNVRSIPVRDLQEGDIVFGTIVGREYRLDKVRHFKHVVQFTRDDGQTETWPYVDRIWDRDATGAPAWKKIDATITVKLDTESSGAVQHYIETGEVQTYGDSWAYSTANPANN